MGMYDDFADLDGRLKCAAGHAPDGWQTKSLDRNMDTYLMKDGRLYLSERGGRCEATTWSAQEDGSLRRTLTDSAQPLTPRTMEVEVHTFCKHCRPVLYAADRPWNGGVSEREPWCEYVLTFVRGVLDEVKPYRLETREDIVREMKGNGDKVLDDEAPAAKAHWAQKERRK